MTFTVINTNDLGAGSLRQAIIDANTAVGPDMISFSIPGAPPYSIMLTSPLPPILEAVVIDGTTQPGFVGSPLIEVNGNALAANGFDINAGPTTIRGLVINRFDGNGIFVRNGNANSIDRNFIGTNVAGTAALPNSGNGIVIAPTAPNTTVGAVGAGPSNIIAFNGGNGIAIEGGGAGNLIRTNSIFSNGLLGIDLGSDGVTPNDAGDADTGANGLQNFPVLTAAASGGGMTTIVGSLNSTPSTTFTLEFFASVACDPSGFGEGATPLGTDTVTTNGAGDAPFNVTLAVGVPAGQVVTATATDPAGNTSEDSACIVLSLCTITCPPNMTVGTPPGTSFGCGVLVTYPAPTTTDCGTVMCMPSSGSFFLLGSTPVTCTTSSGPSCSFLVTVVDRTPPALTCPEDITATLPPGAATLAVDYAVPVASDSCGGILPTTCVPPPGFSFRVGVTPVVCVATDSAGNFSLCTFNVTVRDIEPPMIICPSNISIQLERGQCSTVVSYSAPAVTDNVPGVTFVCSPPSGSSFISGVTPVTCVATDTSGNRASCAFTVTVVGFGQAELTPGGAQPMLDFGPISAKNKPRKRPPSQKIRVASTGCAGSQLTLIFQTLQRTGADVDSGVIRDPDDRELYAVTEINADGSETPVSVGSSTERFIIPAGQERSFRILYNPVTPDLANKLNELKAKQVKPAIIKSRLMMPIGAGAPLTLDLTGRLTTALRLINATNVRKQKRADFVQSGDEFTITFAVFDPNGDTDHVTVELQNDRGELVEDLISLDLVQPIKDSKILVGQSYLAILKLEGALSNPAIKKVRITVFDKESKDEVTAGLVVRSTAVVAQASRNDAATVMLPRLSIRRARQ